MDIHDLAASATHEAFPLPPGAEEGYATTNGVRLHYVAAGELGRPLVLLLHGFPEFWYSWRHLIAPLAERFRVVAPDLRGYNLSEKPGGGYDLASLDADVAGLITAFGAERADVVAHDWGGVIAWDFAARWPDLPRRLVILNAPHLALYRREVWHPRQLRRSLYAVYFQVPWLPEWTLSRHDYASLRVLWNAVRRISPEMTAEDVERYVVAMARPGALSAALAYYRTLTRRGLGGLAPGRRIEAPTLVLWGERDPALGIHLLDGLDRWVADLHIRRFPDAGHWLALQRPNDVAREVLAFLG